jgi:cytochrome c-type biogenesis protein
VDALGPSGEQLLDSLKPAASRTADRDDLRSRQAPSYGYVLLILFGALVLAGFDKHLETVLVNASPQWLTDLTTRF